MGAYGANYGGNYAAFATISVTPATKTVVAILCVNESIKQNLCVTESIKEDLCV